LIQVLIQQVQELQKQLVKIQNEEKSVSITPISSDDYILGNRDADVVVVSFMDFDGPFSKIFYETMQSITDEYSRNEVAWVYRHFPLEQLHPNAKYIAQASECVGEEEGIDAFWEFADMVFGGRDANQRTDLDQLVEYVDEIGMNNRQFEGCLEDDDTLSLVQDDYADAIRLGAQGTPYSVVLADGDMGKINGAQPYSAVKQIIDNLLE
jgi:protein-disulfide isomerase